MTYNEQDARQSATQSMLPHSAQEAPIKIQIVQETDGEEIDLKRYFLAIRHRWRLVALVIAVFVIAGSLYAFTRKPVYEAKIKLLISTSKLNPLAALGTSMPSDFQSLLGNRSVETQMEILSDANLLDEAFLSFDKATRTRAFGDAEEIPDWAVSISSKRSSDVLQVATRSYVPSDAAAMANKIVDLYMKRDTDISNNAIVKTREYAQEKMKLAEKELKEANQRLAEFKKESGLVAPEVQLTKMAEYMASLQTELEMSRAELAATRGETASLRQQISQQTPEVVNGTTLKQNPRFAAAMEDIDKLYSTRIELLQEYKPQAPEIRAVDNRIREQEKLLQELTETIVESELRTRNPIRDTQLTGYSGGIAKEAAMEARIGAIDRELSAQTSKSMVLPEKERELTELMQRVGLLERTFGMMSDKYYALVLSEQGKMPSAHVISSVRVDDKPVYPRRIRTIALFFLLGAAAAVMSVVVLEHLDGRVRERRGVERIAGAPVLGMVSARNGAMSFISRLISPSTLLESYRILRNNICLADAGNKLRTIAVTGTIGNESKSVTSANLAAAMAMDGKRTILVDCDLQSPSLKTLIEARSDSGLSSVINGGCDLKAAVVETDQDNLWFLSTGPMTLNSTEMLNSTRGRQLFKQLADGYDFVVLNCPSTENMSDVQVLSTLSDGLLLVVSLNRTREPEVQSTVQALRRVGGRLLGLVLVETGRLNGKNGSNGHLKPGVNGSKPRTKTGVHGG